MNILIILVINLGLIGLVKITNHYYKLSHFWTRKFLHTTSALVIAFYAIFLVDQTQYLILTFAFTFLYFLLFFGKKFQEIEENKYTNWGTPLYPFALFVIGFFLFNKLHYLQFVILLLGIPDVIAGVYDRLKGKIKSIKASLVYFSFALILAVCYLPIIPAVLITLLLTLIERYTPKGFDNLSVPVVAAIILALF